MSPSAEVDPAAPWAGWLRAPGRPWERVCGGATYGACWDALLRAGPPGRGADRLVLSAGLDPNRRRRP